MNIGPHYKLSGEYTHYTVCRFCLSDQIAPVIDLGYVPLAGGFLKSKHPFSTEKFFPLEIAFCKNCYLLQSTNVISKDTLFKNYFYHSSAIGTLTDHFSTIAEEFSLRLKNKHNSLVVEIGCNDGTLIKQLLKNNIQAVGVDPATNIVKPLIKNGMPIINDYFSTKVARNIIKQYGKADIIFSSNTLAHIENMADIAKGIKTLLKEDGILILETHYLGNLLKELQYDMIYHEHQYYYSLVTLQKFFTMYEMEIFDVTPIPIHAGSMRYYVRNKQKKKQSISPNIKRFLKKEKGLHFNKIETYLKYAKKISKTKKDLLQLLTNLKKEGNSIAGYGASGRGTIIMNYCGLDGNYLDYVIDDAPAKQGLFTPGTHLPICSSDILRSKKKPDYVLLFAWSFIDEIKRRQKNYLQAGGKFIVPLPTVKIFGE